MSSTAKEGRMKWLFAGFCVLLLTSCQSKREICAQWNVLHYTEANKPEVAKSYWKKLGINGEPSTEVHVNYRWRDGVSDYCEFYKS